MKRIFFAIAVMAAAVSGLEAYGQSKSFKLGQWVEIENSVLKELNRSYVDSLPVDRIMRAGIDAMLENLDPYTIYIPEEENEDLQMMLSKTYGGIGAIILKDKDANVIINEPYYGSPAWKNGLRCGDEIITIDGQTTKGLEAKGSSDRMKGKPGTTVNFKVLKGLTGDTVDVAIVRERIHIPDVEYVGMIDDTTGYIRQSGFTDKVSEEVKAGYFKLKEQGMKRLVLDLRDLSFRTFDKKQKREAYERQRGICVYCGKHFELEEMEADHITPWKEGGTTVAENCQMLCKNCNRIKGGK